MRTKSIGLGVVLAVMALLVVSAPVGAAFIPPTANTNALGIAISRPNIIYHDGDTIHYTVIVSVPSITDSAGHETVGEVTNISTSFTTPHGTLAVLSMIGTLVPGSSHSFTAADNPLLDYVIVHADLTKESDGTDIATAFANCAGTSQESPQGDPASAQAQIVTPVLHPNTTVTITASPAAVIGDSGLTTTLIVTEVGPPDEPELSFDQVSVTLNNGTSDFLVLSAEPTSGDTNSNGILDSGETWSWTVSGVAVTGSATTFTATGTGRERFAGMSGSTVTFPGFPSERQAVTVPVLDTVVTIVPSATAVLSGSSVNLVITETNSGGAALTSPQVTVMKNGGVLTTLIAPPDSGDTNTNGILDPGEVWTWTIPSGVITATTTFQANGSGMFGGINDAAPADADEQASVVVDVLGTTVGIQTSAPAVIITGSVNLTITETNNGNVPLTSPQVVVLENGGALVTLIAPPDSGDNGNGILDPGEVWTWTIPSGVISATTTFQATGSGLDGDIVVTFPADTSEQASVVVQDISTSTTITAAAPVVITGSGTTLTVTEANTGSAPLTSPQVVVLKNGAAFVTLTAPPTSGDSNTNGILDPGEVWSWTVATGAITTTTSFQATGAGTFGTVIDTFPADPNEQALTVIQVAATVASIVSSTGSVTSGGTVILTISEANTGTVALTSPQVVVTQNGSTLATLVAPPASGDTNTNGILDPGEVWVWTVTSSAITVDPTTFVAIGSGLSGSLNVTFPAVAAERASTVVHVVVAGKATRTQGFWMTHTAFTNYVFTHYLGSDINIGWKNITNLADLMGIFYASPAKNSDGSKRDKLCQAKEIAAVQVVAAILNSALPNGKPLPVPLATIQSIMSGTNIAAIQALGNTLDAYNGSGDNVAINTPVSQGNATPQTSKAIANIAFANCP